MLKNDLQIIEHSRLLLQPRHHVLVDAHAGDVAALLRDCLYLLGRPDGPAACGGFDATYGGNMDFARPGCYNGQQTKEVAS